MQNTNIRKLIYNLKHRYATFNNVVVTVAVLIGLSWAWGSVQAMQRNYRLAGDISYKERQSELIELETQNLAFEQRYYSSREYQELSARSRMGLADPGEKVLVLPPNSEEAKTADKASEPERVSVIEPGNFAQWLDFLFGANRKA